MIDSRTGTVTGRLGIRSYGTMRAGMLASPDGQRVYLHSGVGVEPVDLRTNLIGDPVVGRDAGRWNEIIGVSADGRRIFGVEGNALVAPDLNSGATQRIAPLTRIPNSAALVPDGSKIYLPSEALSGVDNPLRVIDTTTGTAADVPGTEGANEVALSPDGQTMYTIGYHGVIVLDAATGEVVRRVASGLVQGSNITVAPEGRTMFLLDIDGSVEMFDVEAGRITGSLPVGKYPRDQAITEDARRLFVAIEGRVIAADLSPAP